MMHFYIYGNGLRIASQPSLNTMLGAYINLLIAYNLLSAPSMSVCRYGIALNFAKISYDVIRAGVEEGPGGLCSPQKDRYGFGVCHSPSNTSRSLYTDFPLAQGLGFMEAT